MITKKKLKIPNYSLIIIDFQPKKKYKNFKKFSLVKKMIDHAIHNDYTLFYDSDSKLSNGIIIKMTTIPPEYFSKEIKKIQNLAKKYVSSLVSIFRIIGWKNRNSSEIDYYTEYK